VAERGKGEQEQQPRGERAVPGTSWGHDARMLLFCRLVPSVLVAAALAQVPVVHVAVGGDDLADGSAAHPVRSLVRARDRLRELRGPMPVAGGEVRLHGGVHRLTAALELGPGDGGVDGDGDPTRVRWLPVPGEIVVISGGRVLTGFARQADGTFTLQLPAELRALRELFVGDARRPRARTPDDGFLRVDHALPDRRTGFVFAAGALPALVPEDAAELLFLHDWCVSRVPVRGIDAATATLTTGSPIGHPMAQFAIDNFEPHPRFALENAKSCLDRPGEWCVDKNGVLRYLPLPFEEPPTFTAVAPLATGLLRIRGDETRPVQRIDFVDLAFEHCAFVIPPGGFAEAQANFFEPRGGGTGRMPAAIECECAHAIVLDRLRLSHLGGAALAFGSRCLGCVLLDSEVTDVGGNGVMIGETGERLLGGKSWTEAAPEQATTGGLVIRCTITHCGVAFGGAVGVWVGLAADAYVRDNEIAFLPYSGVSLGWRWDPEPSPVHALHVTGNHIHHVMQLLSDGGGIYTLGRQPGTVLANNRIHDVPANAGRAESNGMFLDEGTTGITIEGNTIWNVDRAPLRFHRAGRNVVRDNVLVERGGTAPITFNSTKPEDIEFTGNTIAREEPQRR
jgi:hypothetical protein